MVLLEEETGGSAFACGVKIEIDNTTKQSSDNRIRRCCLLLMRDEVG